MASGFTQRWNGKVLAKLLGLGSQGITLFSLTGNPNLTPADLLTVDGAGGGAAYSTAGTQTIAGAVGVQTITSSSALSIWTLGALPYNGAELTLAIILNSSGVFIKAAAGSSFDPSTNTVMKSTIASQITLVGISTAKWAIKSVFPASTFANSGLTLSTTT